MDESNVLDPGFLERMNTLLANAEVLGLFEGDEHAAKAHNALVSCSTLSVVHQASDGEDLVAVGCSSGLFNDGLDRVLRSSKCCVRSKVAYCWSEPVEVAR